MDYKVLRWKYEEKSTAVREFFIRQLSSKEIRQRSFKENTLLVLNIPPYCDQESLRVFFSFFGAVEDIFVQQNIESIGSPEDSEKSDFFCDNASLEGYRVAYLSFRSQKSVSKLITYASPDKDPLVYSSVDNPVETGLTSWMKLRRNPLPSLVDLKAEIDAYMDSYDKKVEVTKEKLRAMEGVPDEEGWVTVTRVGKKRGIRQEQATNDEALPAAKHKDAKKELSDFYRFQTGSTKMTQLTELKRKFEEDKQRVALMKASRKFKPF